MSTDLDAVIRDIIESAQRACPSLGLPSDVFVAYLRERCPADLPPVRALHQLHTADLYLACACARGDQGAFAMFDDRCLRCLDRVLLAMGFDAGTIDDVKQDIRSRVLVGDGVRPRINDYSGRGNLRSWVRIMAVRQALQRRRRTHRERCGEDDKLLRHIGHAGDPELDYIKGIYRREFKRAFEAALRALPGRERTVLRQHYIDDLTIDQLGILYRMHRSSAARLVARGRALVLEATRAQLMSRLDVPSRDLDSILRLIQSQLDVSLRALLRRRG